MSQEQVKSLTPNQEDLLLLLFVDDTDIRVRDVGKGSPNNRNPTQPPTQAQNSIRSLAMSTAPEKCFFTSTAHSV